MAVCGQLIGPNLFNLDQNHDEDGHVAQQGQTNKCHHCHKEDNVILYPTAVGREGELDKSKCSLKSELLQSHQCHSFIQASAVR